MSGNSEVDLTTWPEFSRPLPVDSMYIDDFGVQARAHIGTLYYHRGDWEKNEYWRGPWAVVKAHFRHLLMRQLFKIDGHTITFTDETATSRTLRINDGLGETYNIEADTTNSRAKFKYGTGITAPTENDNNIETIAGQVFNASTFTYDDDNKKVIARGSRTHSEAQVNVSEVATFCGYTHTGSERAVFLLDRSAVSPAVTLETGDLIGIAYEWQF